MKRIVDDEDMHRQIDWMVPADATILEFLDAARDSRGRPSIQTPNTIAINTGYSNRHASARCQELAERGLVEKTERGQYRLSDLGEELMRDELSLSELRDLTSDSDENLPN